MSGIVLSASVRQNLLSLQSTADLLATTQNRLSTGKKVNTALDNPTNYFTAAALDNRASDISNLLDGIGNGVQVLQAANTGITSLQKLVDTAKSIANQVLQAPAGYSVKASATTAAPTGAGALAVAGTAADLTNGGHQLAQRRDVRLYARCWRGDHHHDQQRGCRRQRQLDRCFQCGTGDGRYWPDCLVGRQRLGHLHLDQRQCKPDPHARDDRGCEHRRAQRHAAPSRLSRRPVAPPAIRSPMRLRRPFAPTWSPSTTTSFSRSRRRRRTLPSTASIC